MFFNISTYVSPLRGFFIYKSYRRLLYASIYSHRKTSYFHRLGNTRFARAAKPLLSIYSHRKNLFITKTWGYSLRSRRSRYSPFIHIEKPLFYMDLGILALLARRSHYSPLCFHRSCAHL
jgi:hypothetical protein